MKWMIYLLLLMNLGFGLWHYRSQALNESQVQNKSDDDNLRLVLLQEYLAQQDKPPTVETEAEILSGAGKSCYTLGPFKAVNDANSVRNMLKKAKISAKRRVKKDKTRKGFWVLLPPAASHAQARENVEKLKAQGIKDYFLVANGDQTNAVSLGVFAQSDTAQSRYQEIKGMGFNPKIQNVDLPMREYWLDWPVEQVLSTKLLAQIRKQYNGVGQTERSCSPNDL
jgi:hypothetical protein